MNKLIIKILSVVFLISAFLPLEISSIACLLSLIITILAYPYLLKKLFNKFFITIIFISLILYPILAGEKDSSFLFINYSSGSLLNALKIVIRAILILTSFNLIMILTKNYNVNSFWQKLGIKSFDEVYNLSNELMPTAIETFQNSIQKNPKNNIKYALMHPINFISEILANLIHNARKKINDYKFNSMEE